MSTGSSNNEADKDKTSSQNDSLFLRIHLAPSSQPSEGNSNYPSSLKKGITLSHYPQTDTDLKLIIQEEFQIPVCLQKLTLLTHLELKDDLTRAHLRHGDIITVHYTTHGNLNEVQSTIDIFNELCHTIEGLTDKLVNSWTPLTSKEIASIKKPELEKNIEYFRQTEQCDATAKVNFTYFMHNSGVDALVRLHKLLTDIPWKRLPFPLQFVEQWCMTLIWNLSCTVGVRRYLYNYPDIIKLVSKSILRMPFRDDGKEILAPVNSSTSLMIPRVMLTQVLLSVMYKGIGVISNLAELEEYQLAITETPDLIDQMTLAMLCPQYKSVIIHITLATFVCLAYSPATHYVLTKPIVLTRIMTSIQRHHTTTSVQSKNFHIILTNYFVTVFFALVNSSLTITIDNELLLQIVTFMKSFSNETTHFEVRQAELENGYFGTTIKPYVQLCYSTSFPSSSSSPLIIELQLASIRTGILSLLNMSLTDSFVDIVTKENLYDYITCLPWYVTQELRQEATQLVECVNEKIKATPPKLVNIVKAYLAMNCEFSLDEVTSPLFFNETLTKTLFI